MVTGLQFGFDHRRFYLRVDFNRRASDVLADKGTVDVTFLSPPDVRLSVRRPGAGEVRAVVERRLGPDRWEALPAEAAAAAGSVLEIAVDWQGLGVAAGGMLSCFVAICQDGQEVERHPSHLPLEVTVPGPDFRARHWAV
jgi:hypothetical protein